MKLAIAVWNERVSPVFDVSTTILLISDKDRLNWREVKLLSEEPGKKIEQLKELGVKELICGAVSGPVQRSIVASGIKLYPFTSGDIDDVFLAWIDDRLDDGCMSMPGCGRRAKMHRNRKCRRGSL